MLGCQVVQARVVSRWPSEQQVLWSRLTSVDLRNEDKQLSVWCDGHMRLTKELDGAAGVGEEPGVWVCVFSQMVQLWTAAKDGVRVPQTSSVPAASLSAVPVTVWLQGKLSCLFSVEPTPKKKRSFTLNQQLNLLSLWPQDCRIRLAGIWLGGRNKNGLFLVAACRCNVKEVWNKTFPDNSRNRSKKAGCPHGRRMDLKEASEENPSWIIRLHI